MKNLHPAYRIPLYLFFFGLIWIHVPFLNLLTLFAGFILFYPLAVLIPILWIIAIFRKWEEGILWTQVAALSVIASSIAAVFSSWAVDSLQDYQLDRLAIELEWYKGENGCFQGTNKFSSSVLPKLWNSLLPLI